MCAIVCTKFNIHRSTHENDSTKITMKSMRKILLWRRTLISSTASICPREYNNACIRIFFKTQIICITDKNIIDKIFQVVCWLICLFYSHSKYPRLCSPQGLYSYAYSFTNKKYWNQTTIHHMHFNYMMIHICVLCTYNNLLFARAAALQCYCITHTNVFVTFRVLKIIL